MADWETFENEIRGALFQTLGFDGYPRCVIGKQFRFTYQDKGMVFGTVAGLHWERGRCFRILTTLETAGYFEWDFEHKVWGLKLKHDVLNSKGTLELLG